MQIGVLGFMQQVKLFKGIKNIRNEKSKLPLKITTELTGFWFFFYAYARLTDQGLYTQSQLCGNMYTFAHTFWAQKYTHKYTNRKITKCLQHRLEHSELSNVSNYIISYVATIIQM